MASSGRESPIRPVTRPPRHRHERFLEGIRVYGREWSKVAGVVRTRSTVQVRSHAQKYELKRAKELREEAEYTYHDEFGFAHGDYFEYASTQERTTSPKTQTDAQEKPFKIVDPPVDTAETVSVADHDPEEPRLAGLESNRVQGRYKGKRRRTSHGHEVSGPPGSPCQCHTAM